MSKKNKVKTINIDALIGFVLIMILYLMLLFLSVFFIIYSLKYNFSLDGIIFMSFICFFEVLFMFCYIYTTVRYDMLYEGTL